MSHPETLCKADRAQSIFALRTALDPFRSNISFPQRMRHYVDVIDTILYDFANPNSRKGIKLYHFSLFWNEYNVSDPIVYGDVSDSWTDKIFLYEFQLSVRIWRYNLPSNDSITDITGFRTSLQNWLSSNLSVNDNATVDTLLSHVQYQPCTYPQLGCKTRTIYSSDLDCLKPKTWLLGSVISHVGNFINAFTSTWQSKCVVLPSDFLDLMYQLPLHQSKSDSFDATYFVPPRFDNYDKDFFFRNFEADVQFIFAPVYYSQLHWALVFFENPFYRSAQPPHKIYYFDSIPRLGKFNIVMGIIRCFMGHCFSISSSDVWTSTQISEYAQTNGYDCGVYVLLYLLVAIVQMPSGLDVTFKHSEKDL